MRHKRRGRRLGRSSSHRRALMRNLASSLFLTERDPEFYEGLYQADGQTEVQPPKFQGRIVTTIHKAKEVRSFVEKCITIAKNSLAHSDAADEFAVDADRNSDEWKTWRKSEDYKKWNAAMAPAVAARRRVFSMLRNKEAVSILFDEIAPRYVDRPGGYTRVMKLANVRLGDAGVQAILELVGKNDRVAKKSEKPAFDDTEDDTVATSAPAEDEKPTDEAEPATEETSAEESGGDEESKE